MCGIVGYIGSGDALASIIGGLEKLEYRGYDSAGIALIEDGKLTVTRALGKLIELKKLLIAQKPEERPGLYSGAHLGIGHTRWATHGKPSENNAHPHTAGRVSLVHNGIIENYIELRAELQRDGCKFLSETDTEIAAHLLNRFLAQGLEPIKALAAVCDRVRGSYSFVAIDANDPGRLLVAKSATPMIIGIGEGEMIVASDIPAVLAHTRRIIVLEDGDFAEIHADSVTVYRDGKKVEPKIETITWDPVAAQKGGFKHYMLKEIHEQVQVAADAFRGRIEIEDARVVLPELKLTDEVISKIRRIELIGCGTAWHACLVAKYFLEAHTGIPCSVDYASEFRYRSPVLHNDTLVIGVSQSGETADTLAAIEHAGKFTSTLAICNVLGSSLARKAHDVIFTHAGPEISVAATKSFTTQVITLYLLSIYLGQKRGLLQQDRARTLIAQLSHLPTAIAETLKTAPAVEKVARSFYKARDFLYIGRGNCYPIALEGAIKLKEISYIHAEGYPAGEMKHGPIALIDENMPVVAVLQRSAKLEEKMLSNLKEAESREGKIILVTDLADTALSESLTPHVISVPHISEELSPILINIPLQFLAYYVAVFNGTDVDLPRNLAKSVTVE